MEKTDFCVDDISKQKCFSKDLKSIDKKYIDSKCYCIKCNLQYGRTDIKDILLSAIKLKEQDVILSNEKAIMLRELAQKERQEYIEMQRAYIKEYMANE